MDELISKLEQLRRNIDLVKAHHEVLNDLDPAGQAQRAHIMLDLLGKYEDLCKQVSNGATQRAGIQQDLFTSRQEKLETDSNPMWVWAQTVVAGWIASALGNAYDKDN